MRLTKLAVGAAVAGLVLAGCGEDGGSDDGTSVAESDDGTGDESGGDAEFAISEGKGGGAELFEAMTAAYEDVGSYHFEMDMEAEGEQVSAEGGAEFGSDVSAANMRMGMQVPDMGEMSMLLVDGVFYMSLPPEAGLPTDTPWLRVDLDADDPMAQSFGDLAEDMSLSAEVQSDFVENSDLIAVEEGGTDTIDGVDVTEYVLTIDSEDATEYMEATDQAPDASTVSGEVTYSLWVDGDLLPRRMTADLGDAGSMEMRFFDFGEPVDVEAPPEDEVTDFSSLMGDMSQ